MRKALNTILLSIILLFGSIGCSTLGDYTVTKRQTIEKQIIDARVDTEKKMLDLQVKEKKLLQESIDQHLARSQGAADYLFKGSVVFSSLKPDQVSRPTLVMGQSIQQTAAQLPPATPTAQAAAFKAIQIELDEVKTSTEALKAQYEIELGKAKKEGEDKAKAIKDLEIKVKTVESERVEVLTKANAIERDLQATKDKVQDAELAKSKQSEEQAKRSEKMKMWLMGILLTAAAACGVGAAFLPIPNIKTKLVIGAAVCGGAALALPFIEPWMVIVTVGVILLLVGAWIIKNYKDEHGDAQDTYRALQEYKTKASDKFKTELAPILKQWHTNPDTPKRIDKKLKQVGDI